MAELVVRGNKGGQVFLSTACEKLEALRTTYGDDQTNTRAVGRLIDDLAEAPGLTAEQHAILECAGGTRKRRNDAVSDWREWAGEHTEALLTIGGRSHPGTKRHPWVTAGDFMDSFDSYVPNPNEKALTGPFVVEGIVACVVPGISESGFEGVLVLEQYDGDGTSDNVKGLMGCGFVAVHGLVYPNTLAVQMA